MKAKFLGETDVLSLTCGEIYDILSVELGPDDSKWFRVVLEDDDDDESGLPGYLYPAEDFEIVEG